MGILLMQDHGEKEMIRLAFGLEALVHSVILKARKELGVSSNSPSTPSTPSSPSPFGGSMCFSRQNSSSSATSGRILGGLSLPSPLSITSNNNHSSNVPASWSTSPSFSEFQEADLVSPSASNISYTAASRQIYLTFPANSTFKEEDVSNYFSTYGPAQDVRIPYQQKRMFGFVTFVYPETVKTILAKGNPQFVCDARVLVKPCKEKGKVPEKFRKQPQQQMERGEFTGCGSPTGLDSSDPYDLQLGARMFYNTQDALWRRKLEEQADLQQAIELQSRRLLNLQLLDVKRSNHHRALSMSAVIPSPPHSPGFFNQNMVRSTDFGSREGISCVLLQ